MKSLSRATFFIVVSSFLLSLITIYAVLYASLKRHYKNQLNATAEGISAQVFNSMYQVMKRGWKREDLIEFLRSLEVSYQNTPLSINVYRGDKVKELFGDVPEPKRDAWVLKAFEEKREISITREGKIVHINPIVARSECLRCHVNAQKGDVLGVIETRFDAAELVRGVNRSMVVTLLFLLPINLLLASGAALLIQGSVRRVQKAISENIEKLNSIGDIERLGELEELPYREFENIRKSLQELARKIREIAIDRGVLDLEAKILEKFIITSKLVEDWRKYVSALLIDINDIVEINVVFSVFAEDSSLNVEVFWLKEPDRELRSYLEELIQKETLSRLPLSVSRAQSINFNHNVANGREEFCCVEKDAIKLKTKVLFLDKPQLGGIVGVGINSDLVNDPYKHSLVDVVLATLINVIGSAKAINTYIQEIEFRAMRDPLTFLYNQRSFWELLNYEIERAERFGRKLAILMLDLDNFKVVNDTYGHAFGDNVLKEVARVIAENKRKADVAARYGGDEFAIIAVGADLNQAYSLAKRVKESVEQLSFFVEDNKVITLQVSVGVAIYPDHARNPKDLFLMADKMLRKAKEEGRSRIKVPTYEDLQETSAYMTRKSILVLDSLNRRLIKPFFQPIVDLKTGEVVANEALMRIGNENLPAGEFIEVAENLGIITRMDMVLYEEVFKKMRAQGYTKAIFLNLSSKALLMENFVSNIESMLGDYDIEPEKVVFELTERESVKSIELVEKFTKSLRESGIKFAIDDFGSGFSSFHYLKKIPADYVKIEGDFVRDIVSDWRDRTFINSIVALAKGMGIKTVAEYVESKEILEALREAGVDCGQGFYFGKPSPELRE
ncbi:EAL domain-containing protein [Hydrogenivirga sp.]